MDNKIVRECTLEEMGTKPTPMHPYVPTFSHIQIVKQTGECIESDYTEFHTHALHIAELLKKKQLNYGDSFRRCPEIMEILYPNGITVEQYPDVLAVTRIIDKLFRIASPNSDKEDPWQDIGGYAILSMVERDSR